MARLQNYEQIPIEGCTGPGTYVVNGPWRLVLHTTESGPNSTNAVIGLFRSRPCSTPHFCINPADRRKIQFIRTEWACAALANAPGGVETNRIPCIQVEIVGWANETHNWPDEYLQFIGEFIADVIRSGIPLNLDNVPEFLGAMDGTIATSYARQRFSPAKWNSFDGVCGHQHVPENDHWDPGKINIKRVIEHARASLAGTATPLPTPTKPVEPSPVVPNYGENVIGPGMAGGIVKFAQELIKGLGYDVGVVDGVYGPQTTAAVKAFQKDAGVGVDGYIGPQTQKAIADKYAAIFSQPVPVKPVEPPKPQTPAFPGTTQKGSVGYPVKLVQQRLKDRGWSIDVDGQFGPGTDSIVRAFQREKNLTPDGIVGPQTWAALWTAPVT